MMNKTSNHEFSLLPSPTPCGVLRKVWVMFGRGWQFIQTKAKAQPDPKQLRLVESISLGERRFVAVVQVDGLRFLVGGGASNVNLLAEISAGAPFARTNTQSRPCYPVAVQKGGTA